MVVKEKAAFHYHPHLAATRRYTEALMLEDVSVSFTGYTRLAISDNIKRTASYGGHYIYCFVTAEDIFRFLKQKQGANISSEFLQKATLEQYCENVENQGKCKIATSTDV